MLQALIVAAVLATSPPSAQPASPLTQAVPSASVAFAQLKQIASVRSTPFCTTLRTKIGPAIGNMLVADDAIEASVPLYGKMYRDDVIFHSRFMEFDVIKLEYLIRPLVNSTLDAQALLAGAGVNPKDPKNDDDRRMLDMRAKLASVLQQQKDVANLVSGFVDTYQLGQMMNAGPPAGWIDSVAPSTLSAIVGSGSRPPAPRITQAPSGASALLEPQSRFHGGLAQPPEFDPELAALGHDPYAPFATWTSEKRSTIAQGETLAAQAVIAAVALCK